MAQAAAKAAAQVESKVGMHAPVHGKHRMHGMHSCRARVHPTSEGAVCMQMAGRRSRRLDAHCTGALARARPHLPPRSGVASSGGGD